MSPSPADRPFLSRCFSPALIALNLLTASERLFLGDTLPRVFVADLSQYGAVTVKTWRNYLEIGVLTLVVPSPQFADHGRSTVSTNVPPRFITSRAVPMLCLPCVFVADSDP